jgi:hypothetical protein
MGFNLDNYETVKERKKRFYNDYKDGRIIVSIVNPESILEHAFFVCHIYKNADDQKNFLPFSTGYAHEIREKEKKVNQYGKPYESVNYTCWSENSEESCIGRALDNAGYSGNNKCSREEIIKVEKNNLIQDESVTGYKKEKIKEEIKNTSNPIHIPQPPFKDSLFKEPISSEKKIEITNLINKIMEKEEKNSKEILKELSCFKNKKGDDIFIISVDDNKLTQKWAEGILNKANKKLEELMNKENIVNEIPF